MHHTGASWGPFSQVPTAWGLSSGTPQGPFCHGEHANLLWGL